MIEFKNDNKDAPYIIFKEKYNDAIAADQKNIEAIAISTFNTEKDEVDSRYVNLKFIDNDKFIFFSNYNSPKSNAISSFNQIGALLYWQATNVQIRMKAKISKTSTEFNKQYFAKRSVDKNALAISSNQSKNIESYDAILLKYQSVKDKEDLHECPSYWGGFEFTPFYFEFWEGHDSRINKREVFSRINGNWKHYILEP